MKYVFFQCFICWFLLSRRCLFWKRCSKTMAKMQLLEWRKKENFNLRIISGPFEVKLYTILKLTLCSFIRYIWILGAIGCLWGICMSNMAFLVVNLTIFWNSRLRLAEKTPKFNHLASDFAKMHKVNPFSIHFYYSNLLLTQFSKNFIVFLLGHCVLRLLEDWTKVSPTQFCLLEVEKQLSNKVMAIS